MMDFARHIVPRDRKKCWLPCDPTGVGNVWGKGRISGRGRAGSGRGSWTPQMLELMRRDVTVRGGAGGGGDVFWRPQPTNLYDGISVQLDQTAIIHDEKSVLQIVTSSLPSTIPTSPPILPSPGKPEGEKTPPILLFFLLFISGTKRGRQTPCMNNGAMVFQTAPTSQK